MKRQRTAITDQASKNPSVVLRAFAPDTEFVLTLDGWMLMESLDLPITRGERPKSRDLIIAMLVMTDEVAVRKAIRTRKIDELVKSATKGKSVGDIMAFAAKVTEAVEQAFEPSDTGVETVKKDSAEPAGGSA